MAAEMMCKVDGERGRGRRKDGPSPPAVAAAAHSGNDDEAGGGGASLSHTCPSAYAALNHAQQRRAS